jgi:hypothetical protein
MTRKRKPETAARIELSIWFEDVSTYNAFASADFASKSKTVSDREWVEALDYGAQGIEARFRFTHTCRNSGAQRSDSERFFAATCRAAGIDPRNAGVFEVSLLERTTVAT